MVVTLLLCASCFGQESAPEGTQRQTRLVIPELRPDVAPELVLLPALGHEGLSTGVAFSRDGRTFASCSPTEVVAWDVAARAPRWRARWEDPRPQGQGNLGGLGRVSYEGLVTVSGDGALVAVTQAVTDERTVRMWDTRTSSLVASWALPIPLYPDLAGCTLSPDGTELTMCYAGSGEVLVCDARSGRRKASYMTPRGVVVRLAGYRADGTLAAVVGTTPDVTGDPSPVDRETGLALPALAITAPATTTWYDISMSVDGRWVVVQVVEPADAFPVYGGEKTLALQLVDTSDWSVRSRTRAQKPFRLGRLMACSERHVVRQCALGEDYRDGYEIQLTDLQTGSTTTLDQSYEYASLAFSPDGALLATPAGLVTVDDRRVLVQVAARRPGRRLCLFAADGRSLVSCSEEGGIVASRTIGRDDPDVLQMPSRSARCVYLDNFVSVWDSADGVRVFPSGVVDEVRQVAVVPGPASRSFVAPRGPFDRGNFAVGLRADGTVLSAGSLSTSDNASFAIRTYTPNGALATVSPEQLQAEGCLQPPDGATVSLPDLGTGRYTWSCPAFSPDARKLAFACLDTQGIIPPTIVVFDLTTARISKAFPLDIGAGASSGVGMIQFLADGRTLIVDIGTWMWCEVRIYNAETFECAGRWQRPVPLPGSTGTVHLVLLAVSPDGSFAAMEGVMDGATWGGVSVCRLSDGVPLGVVPPGSVAAFLTSACFSPDGSLLAVSYPDGTAALWDVLPLRDEGQGRLLGTIVNGATGEWATVVPQGFVDCSLGARRLLGWQLGDSVYPFEQFAAKYRRPDLVRRALAGEDISAERALSGADIPPTTVFLSPEYGAAVNAASVKVEIEAAGARPIEHVELVVDGRPIPEELAATAKTETLEANHTVTSFDLPLPRYQRRLRLQAIAHDSEGLQSAPAEVTVAVEGAPPPTTVLYALSVGVSVYRNEEWNNLKYADKDAESFARVAGEGAARKVLLNENATASNVRFALEEMKASVTEDDIVAIFLAGHGTVDGAGNYYMLLHDSDVADLENTALPWDDFVAALKSIRAKLVMVFADTCHSGSITGQESVNTLIDRLNRRAGVVVFTASRGDEASIEREDWGHGAFTKALLEGFGGAADTYPKDKQVSLAELRDYVIQRVEELTSGRQHPYLPRLEEFDPARPIANVLPGLT